MNTVKNLETPSYTNDVHEHSMSQNVLVYGNELTRAWEAGNIQERWNVCVDKPFMCTHKRWQSLNRGKRASFLFIIKYACQRTP